MALLFRCLMEVRAVIGEVDPPPLPGIGASTSTRRLEWQQAASREDSHRTSRLLPEAANVQEHRLTGFRGAPG